MEKNSLAHSGVAIYFRAKVLGLTHPPSFTRKQVIDFLIRYVYFFSGIFIASFGNYLTILAQNLGVSPWDVFHLGVAKHIPALGLGTIGMIVGAVVFIPSFFLGIKPTFGALINMYFYGVVLDKLISQHVVHTPDNLFMSLLYLLAGIVIIGLGTAIFLLAETGFGPRDALMLGLHKKTGKSIAKVRTGIEVSVVILGVLLGGSLGIGTLIYSFTVGLSLDVAMRVLQPFQREPQAIQSRDM